MIVVILDKRSLTRWMKNNDETEWQDSQKENIMFIILKSDGVSTVKAKPGWSAFSYLFHAQLELCLNMMAKPQNRSINNQYGIDKLHIFLKYECWQHFTSHLIVMIVLW